MDQNNILKLDQYGNINQYDKNWNILKTIEIGTEVPVLSKGKNRVTVDAEFLSKGSSTLRLEMKTVGGPEAIASKK